MTHESAQNPVPRKRHGFTRPHLVEEHGYDGRYVETTDLSRLMVEHDRLHADDTGKHLGHRHDA